MSPTPGDDGGWKPALVAANVPRTRENGMHALRHFYASVLLDAGESIRALADYLGHEDPGFTLRVYTHLMPSSQDRTKKAVDRALLGEAADGPSTASAPDVHQRRADPCSRRSAGFVAQMS